MTMTSTLTAQFSKPPTSTTQLYRIDAAERKLGVSRSTIYRLVNEGQLELVKIGKRSSRITAVSLDALIERCREPA